MPHLFRRISYLRSLALLPPVLCLVAAMCRAAAAEPLNAKDIMIVGQALHFVEPPLQGAIRVAVVYNQATPGSEREANQIVDQFDGELTVGSLSMRPVAVSLAQIAQTPFDALISADGAGTATLRQALMQRHVPCVTGHREQVTDGFCQIYLTSQPNVDIQLNQAASDAASVHFATAFRIMIHTL
ncbi:hypothetical protein [Acetobacter sp. DsW_063]|uniref:hypothetical protein n=1 Tax=Acetobacter sp. DsW_063 TaxID=1514894 RepID=UPI000B63C7B3|nr:hypothetical protein [Acetobacter sp. DsW_063]OUJ14164.1 hypothetical protein HK28_00690 [Acetobacter sp. DsW_063]